MEFLSLSPFVPSGPEFEKSKQLFLELGFDIKWDGGDYIGFEKGHCQFILQRFDRPEFAQQFMVTITVDDVRFLRSSILEKRLPERFGARIGEITNEPYGKELNMIDIAGVCWHFIEQ